MVFAAIIISIFECREPPTLSITPFLIGSLLLTQPISNRAPEVSFDSLHPPHLFSPLDFLKDHNTFCILFECLGLCFFRFFEYCPRVFHLLPTARLLTTPANYTLEYRFAISPLGPPWLLFALPRASPLARGPSSVPRSLLVRMPPLKGITRLLRLDMPTPRPSLRPRPRLRRSPLPLSRRARRPSTSTAGALITPPRSLRCSPTRWTSTRPVPWCWTL